MSKVGFFLRGSRGSVGDVTLKKGQNGTIMSAKATVVRNPKTPKQNAQRVIFTLIAYATSFLKPLVNHSFEGKNGVNENLQAFRKLNLERFRALSAMQYQADNEGTVGQNAMYTIRGIKTLIPNSYIVSQGSLNYHGALYCDADTTEDNVNIFFRQRDISSKVTNDEGTIKMAVSDWLDIVFGISHVQEQFTLVGVQIDKDDVLFEPDSGSFDIAKIKKGGRLVRRIVISESANLDKSITLGEYNEGTFTQVSSGLMRTQLADVLDWNKTNGETLLEVLDEVNYSYSQSGDVITATLGSGSYIPHASDGFNRVKALGIIISRYENGKWRYSNCTLTTLPLNPHLNEEFEYGMSWYLANQYWERAYQNAPNAAFLDTGEEDTTNLDA